MIAIITFIVFLRNVFSVRTWAEVKETGSLCDQLEGLKNQPDRLEKLAKTHTHTYTM